MNWILFLGKNELTHSLFPAKLKIHPLIANFLRPWTNLREGQSIKIVHHSSAWFSSWVATSLLSYISWLMHVPQGMNQVENLSFLPHTFFIWYFKEFWHRYLLFYQSKVWMNISNNAARKSLNKWLRFYLQEERTKFHQKQF